jgi:hypothetical protein
MSDFTTSATLELQVPDAQLRNVRQDIEDAVGDINLSATGSGNASRVMTDGGTSRGLNPAQSRRLRREEITLARQRTEQLGDIVTLLEDGDLGGGGGGGGGAGGFGIGLSALTGAAAGGGGAGILSRLGSLRALTGLRGAGIPFLPDGFGVETVDPEEGLSPGGGGDLPSPILDFISSSIDGGNIEQRLSQLETIPQDARREVLDQLSNSLPLLSSEELATVAREQGVVVPRGADLPSTTELTQSQKQETATGGSGVGGTAGISERRRDFIINNNVEFSGPTQQEIEKQIDKSVQRLKRDIRKELPRGVGP